MPRIDEIDYSHLPAAERAALAQELWDSVHADSCAAPFTPEQIAELDRRMAALDSGEMNAEPWEAIRGRLLRNS